jgi:hypothetical protein
MSYQVTPSISYAADGSEVVSYENATIEDSRHSESIGSRGYDESDYVFDQRLGYERHRFSDVDGEELERRLDAEDLPDDYTELTEEVTVDLMGLVGGVEQYQQLTSWAAQALPSDWIADFDAIVDNGSPGQIQEAIETLLSLAEQEGFEATAEETHDSDPELDQLYELSSEPEYISLKAWAAENLSPEQIQWYDSQMEGDADDIRQAISWLAELQATY